MEHGIVPKQIVKSTEAILGTTGVIEVAAEVSGNEVARSKTYDTANEPIPKAAEKEAVYEADKRLLSLTKEQLKKEIKTAQRKMQQAAKDLDFIEAAKQRDAVKRMQDLLDGAR